MPSNTTLTEDRPGILSRCWAVVYEALLGAATCLVCGMGLLKYLEESDRRGQESPAPAPLPIPAQRRGNSWERIPPDRG